MPPLAQATQRQQRLALATAPFALQVDVQNSHERFTREVCRSAPMSFPSFLNFSHTARAAIREMSQPREPSRKPPRSRKVLTQVQGVASHIAARHLRFPATYIWRAASVV